MSSILKNLRERIQDVEEGKVCKCHRPSLLTFPDIEDNFKIVETKVIEVVNSEVQYERSEVTALCTICKTLWIVNITSSSDRRTRIWKRQN